MATDSRSDNVTIPADVWENNQDLNEALIGLLERFSWGDPSSDDLQTLVELAKLIGLPLSVDHFLWTRKYRPSPRHLVELATTIGQEHKITEAHLLKCSNNVDELIEVAKKLNKTR